ncbi:MAG: hypothetical protein INQ03_26030 [Candidatus Heimdallarchaeota archaeon]|nr:hypothetical protein [Candidatus Heimdallarchaeota archaeon]
MTNKIKLLTKNPSFVLAINAVSVMINAVVLYFLFDWEGIIYPLGIALGIFFLPRLIIFWMKEKPAGDERMEQVIRRTAKASINFIAVLSFGIATICLFTFSTADALIWDIVYYSYLVSFVSLWVRAGFVELEFKIFSEVLVEFEKIEFLAIFATLVSFLAFFISMDWFEQGRISSIILFAFIVLAFMMIQVYFLKFDKKDERIEMMIEKASLRALNILNLVFLLICIILGSIYLFNNSDDFLQVILIFSSYLIITSLIRTVLRRESDLLLGGI